MRHFNNVSVKKNFPKQFILLLLFTLLITLPGEAHPRFVAPNNPLLPQQVADSDNFLTPAQLLKALRTSLIDESITSDFFGKCINIAGGMIGDLSDEQCEAIARNGLELTIEKLDQELHPVTTEYFSATGNRTSLWNYELAGVNLLKTSGFNGAGTRIGVIAHDYAIDHVALIGRIKAFKSIGVVEPKTPTRSTADLHLVHPLGILTGNEEGRFIGIAPETEVSLAVISAKLPKTDSLLEAIEWLTSQEQQPDAILICTDFLSTPPVSIARALSACRNIGIIPIVAAGNNPNQITGMAALPSCVTIGAIDRWKQRALFSGQGPVVFAGQKILKPDFCAPGSAIYGPADGKDYKFGSGTLQAAAHFAGFFLLMRQARPDTDPEYLLSVLRITCRDLGDTGADYQTGAGLPEPAAALAYIDNPPQNN